MIPNRKSVLAKMPWNKPLDAANFPMWCNINVFPEMMRLLNKIELVRQEEGLISVSRTLDLLRIKIEESGLFFEDGTLVTIDHMAKIFNILTHSSRGKFLAKTQTEYTRFSSNVPLFMSAFKEFRNLKYSEWDWEDPKLGVVLDKEMIKLINCIGTEYDWSSEELVELGKLMRTAGTGDMANMNSNKTNKTGDTFFDCLPSQVRRLLAQTWAYQPHIVSEFAIRNLIDIDDPANPLQVAELDLFTKTTKKEPVKESIGW